MNTEDQLKTELLICGPDVAAALGVAALTPVWVDEKPKLKQQLNTALHIIADQYDAAGGHFLTPEADLMFREAFTEWGESIPEALKRLLCKKVKKGIDSTE